jgi:hypothetical protein
MRDKIAGFLKFVHTLLQPVLGWNDHLKVRPLVNDYRG